MRYNYLRIIPLICWCGLIFFLSSQDAIGVSESKAFDIALHKLAHLFEYAVLYMCYFIALPQVQKVKGRSQLVGILFVFVYGISDEVHQSLNPTRSPRVYDVVIDTLGGTIGLLIAKAYLKILHK